MQNLQGRRNVDEIKYLSLIMQKQRKIRERDKRGSRKRLDGINQEERRKYQGGIRMIMFTTDCSQKRRREKRNRN